jgi:hypothetical protein
MATPGIIYTQPQQGNFVSEFFKDNFVWMVVLGGGVYIIFFTEVGKGIRCVLNPVSCLAPKIEDAWDDLKDKAGDVKQAGQEWFVDYAKATEGTFFRPVFNAAKESAKEADHMFTDKPSFTSTNPLIFGFKMGQAIGSGIKKSGAESWDYLQNLFKKKKTI